MQRGSRGSLPIPHYLSAEKAKVNRTAWFFCWLSRILLEKVTSYCAHRSEKDYKEKRIVKIKFSDRGGVNIDDLKLYYRYLSEQSRMGMLYLNKFDLAWSAVDLEFYVHSSKQNACWSSAC